MWPSDLTLAMTLILNFQGQIEICHIPTTNSPIATNWVANISIEFYASNAIIRFELGHDLDFGFSRSNFETAVSQE